ncbi:hypothetical protein AB9F35_21880 [Rhizobium leguminosarum]|uniref:hypothetical protein n=1 Tax=Rhizobium leguminosarum TaxID=384 RepID=UPI003F9C6E13
MLKDYLSGRQNVLQEQASELNTKLQAIAFAFGEGWLNSEDAHPLQALWQRQDALATNELLNFGDAVERLQQEASAWLKGQVRAIKTGDAGQAAGAIFEILALNLFSRQSCLVVPAPDSMPGFDGTLLLDDDSRVLISVKNHGLSTREREFLTEAKAIDEEFKALLKAQALSGLDVNVLAAKHLDSSLFKGLKTDIAHCLAEFTCGRQEGTLDRPYTISLRDMALQYGPLSMFELSSSCRIMAPIAPNEQANFEDAIRKGCNNLYKHTKGETADVCRMIILRLSNTASVAKCHDWARWYFAEYPNDPIEVILLYQSAVVTDASSDSSSITHYISCIPGPRFADWQRRPDGSIRRLPNLSVLVGTISTQQPTMLLINEKGNTLDMSGYYIYQRADAYKRVDFHDGATGDLSNPATGIMIHAIFEHEGTPVVTISSKAEREKVLALLP